MNDRVDLAEVPLSAVRRVGELLFVSGQVPIDTKTGLTVEGSLTAQLSQVMANLEGVVLSVGADMADVVKTTVYMTDIRDLAEMNAEYRTHFAPGRYPARTTVQVSALAKSEWLIEIEAVVNVGQN
jgi:2-iminobutanoate/2-iminopropanoate deaminase